MTSQIYELGPFKFESGDTLPNLKLSYRALGSLNESKDNAVLIPTWYGGTAKDMEEKYVGQGRAIDPEKYFIVIIDQIGNGESSSPDNTPSPHNAVNFPAVRISDDVEAQRMLLEKLGIPVLALVFGGSMGGMQTYEWAVRFPEVVKRGAVLGAYAVTSDHCTQLPSMLEMSITIVPGWRGGMYESKEDLRDGLVLHSMILARVGFCPEFYRKRLYKDIEDMGQDSVKEFEREYMNPLFSKFDPNNLICMARKWKHADVSRGYESLDAALGQVKAKMLIMPIEQDEMFTPAEMKAEHDLVPNSVLRAVSSELGHVGMHNLEMDFGQQVDNHLRELLAYQV